MTLWFCAWILRRHPVTLRRCPSLRYCGAALRRCGSVLRRPFPAALLPSETALGFCATALVPCGNVLSRTAWQLGGSYRKRLNNLLTISRHFYVDIQRMFLYYIHMNKRRYQRTGFRFNLMFEGVCTIIAGMSIIFTLMVMASLLQP